MQLSNDPTTRQSQLTLIKNYVEANHTAGDPPSGLYDQSTADAMNELASPEFWVWLSNLSTEASGMAISMDEVAGLTTANSNRLNVSFAIRPGGFTPASQDDRSLFGSVFSAAGGVKTRTALMEKWQRQATIAEELLATGTGTKGVGLETDGATESGSPAVLGDGAEGDITLNNLQEAETKG